MSARVAQDTRGGQEFSEKLKQIRERWRQAESLPAPEAVAPAVVVPEPARKLSRKDAGLLKRLDITTAAVAARAQQKQALGYTAEFFLRFGLPIAKREPGVIYERTDGQLSFYLYGDPGAGGMPYGDDLRPLLWLCSAFVQLGCPEDNTITARSPNDIVAAWRGPSAKLDRHGRRRLRQSFARIAGARFCARPVQEDAGKLERHYLEILSDVDLWFGDPQKGQRLRVNQHTLEQAFPNRFVLSPRLADILRAKTPTFDFDTIRALGDHELAVRFYLWAGWRSYRLDSEQGPSAAGMYVLGPSGVAKQIGCGSTATYKVLQDVREAIEHVREAWPELPVQMHRNAKGTYILLVKRGRAVTDGRGKLPGIRRAVVDKALPGSSYPQSGGGS